MTDRTMLFNPYTGKPRTPLEIAADPTGERVEPSAMPEDAIMALALSELDKQMAAAWAAWGLPLEHRERATEVFGPMMASHVLVAIQKAVSESHASWERVGSLMTVGLILRMLEKKPRDDS